MKNISVSYESYDKPVTENSNGKSKKQDQTKSIEQHGLIEGKATLEKSIVIKSDLYLCFMSYTDAFDSVNLRNNGTANNYTLMTKNCN